MLHEIAWGIATAGGQALHGINFPTQVLSSPGGGSARSATLPGHRQDMARAFSSGGHTTLRMTSESRDYLLRQFDTAWKLASVHLDGLTTEQCMWRPAQVGLHVRQTADDRWRADWPDTEAYDIGPPSIAWISWHIVFWWSMVLDHTFAQATLTRESVFWPGSADQVRAQVHDLAVRWREQLASMSDDDLKSTQRTRWPFKDRPLGDVVAWVNVELTKNAAEIGYARFLHAVRQT